MIVLSSCLPKMGVMQKFPRKVVHGPTNEGGLGILDLYHQQGISRIATIQEHLAAPTIIGDLIQNSIEALKLEIGINRNIFELDFKLYGCLATECWIKETWRYAHENQNIHNR